MSIWFHTKSDVGFFGLARFRIAEYEKWKATLESRLSNSRTGIKGPGKLIETLQIIHFERDENKKGHIFLDIHITPFFPAKSFPVMIGRADLRTIFFKIIETSRLWMPSTWRLCNLEEQLDLKATVEFW